MALFQDYDFKLKWDWYRIPGPGLRPVLNLKRRRRAAFRLLLRTVFPAMLIQPWLDLEWWVHAPIQWGVMGGFFLLSSRRAVRRFFLGKRALALTMTFLALVMWQAHQGEPRTLHSVGPLDVSILGVVFSGLGGLIFAGWGWRRRRWYAPTRHHRAESYWSPELWAKQRSSVRTIVLGALGATVLLAAYASALQGLPPSPVLGQGGCVLFMYLVFCWSFLFPDP